MDAHECVNSSNQRTNSPPSPHRFSLPLSLLSISVHPSVLIICLSPFSIIFFLSLSRWKEREREWVSFAHHQFFFLFHVNDYKTFHSIRTFSLSRFASLLFWMNLKGEKRGKNLRLKIFFKNPIDMRGILKERIKLFTFCTLRRARIEKERIVGAKWGANSSKSLSLFPKLTKWKNKFTEKSIFISFHSFQQSKE